ncbi:hypothetical protein K438DRAFT_1939821 [Mycena galopus ATCC 62051]|nr:hypothetical protein K438DRAFT_1939821 [Mycena galopus ATCC 62051]
MTTNEYGYAQATPPRFPPELEREILETTVSLYPHTIPRLLRVTRRFLTWIEPLLYNRVSIPGLQEKSGNGAAILRAIERKPADFFPKAVRHLYLFAMDWTLFNSRAPDRWSDGELGKVLRACTGVVNLLLIGDLAKPKLLPMVADMRPKRLLLLAELMSPHLDHTLPLFHNISHLFLGDSGKRGGVIQAGWPMLENLALLPSLTHLGLASCTALDVVSSLLSDCPHLRCLIVSAHEVIPDLEDLHDHRLVLMIKTQNIVEDWEVGTRGGRDIWVRADALIMRISQAGFEGPHHGV